MATKRGMSLERRMVWLSVDEIECLLDLIESRPLREDWKVVGDKLAKALPTMHPMHTSAQGVEEAA
jgi:hypothetical protein